MLGTFAVVSAQQITFAHRWPALGRKISAFVRPQKPYNTKLTPQVLSEFRGGGLTFFIRHATRDKITSMPAFDRLMLASSIREHPTYKTATCLNEQGKAEAWVLGKVFGYVGIPVGTVYASPACRTRETAKIAFSRIDRADRALLYSFSDVAPHVTPKEEDELHLNKIEALIHEIPKRGNTVIVSHADALIGTELAKVPLTEAGMVVFKHLDAHRIEVIFQSSLPEFVVQAIPLQ